MLRVFLFPTEDIPKERRQKGKLSKSSGVEELAVLPLSDSGATLKSRLFLRRSHFRGHLEILATANLKLGAHQRGHARTRCLEGFL